jgi:lysophospholipid acyltransferase (LPLAT)-like uncharacterized protein
MERARTAAIAVLGGALVTGILRSSRWDLVAGREWEAGIVEAGVPAIYVLWHGRLLPCAYHYRRFGFATVITRHRDGDYITRMIQNWGYQVIRGSSSEGGMAALRAIIRVLRAGNSVAVTPDGPRGPRQKMKLGPLQAAQIAGVPIVPVSAGAVSAWFFGKWDRFLVPKPLTWIPVAIGEPVRISGRAGEEDLNRTAAVLEERLNQLTNLVDEHARARRA